MTTWSRLFAFMLVMLFSISAMPPSGQCADISELVTHLKGKNLTPQERREARKALRASRPKTSADVKALIAAAGEDDSRDAALAAIRQIDSSAPAEVAGEIVAQVDVVDDTNDLRILRTVVDTSVSRNLSGARERIRARLNKEPKTRIKSKGDKEFLWRNNWEKGKMIGRVQILAEALAKLGDIESLNSLFELDEVMASGQAGTILRPYGLMALQKAIDAYPKEEGLRKDGCISVITSITPQDAIPTLKQLTESADPRLRKAAIDALIRSGDKDLGPLLDRMATDSDASVRAYIQEAMYRRHPEKYVQQLLDSLWGRGPMYPSAALGILAESPQRGTEEDLKKFIAFDEERNRHDPTLRFFAAKSLWKLTGERIQYDRGLATDRKYPWGE